MIYDHCVIGGGIVGMASAMALLRRRPGSSVLVLEKETDLARHQTGHNSGVIHSGIYYQPGSLKAELSRKGAGATKEFCAEHGMPVKSPASCWSPPTSGSAPHGRPGGARAANKIEARRVSAAELREMEPNVAGVGALLVPVTAIVDYAGHPHDADVVVEAGGQVELGQTVTGIEESGDQVAITTPGATWRARRLVVCAGLQADRVARLAGLELGTQIVPFRGEYFQLPRSGRGSSSADLSRPRPDLPFLGVHLTPMVDGRVTVGPNAVLGLAREGYRKGSVNRRDVRDNATFPGFWQVARGQVRTGAIEMRNSLFKRGYLEACRRYCPSLQLSDLLPHEAGIRAQAVRRRHDGARLPAGETARSLHVLNAPSPAATSAIPIGEMIADRALAAA